MNRKFVKRSAGVLVASLVLVGVMVTAGTSAAAPKAVLAAKPLKVALLFDAAAKDGAFDQQAYNGMLAAHTLIGNKFTFTIEQNVPFSTEATAIVDHLIGQGYTLFFVDSAGYDDYLDPVAKAHPNVRIEEYSAAVTAANYGGYEPDEYEAFYLAGEMLAGASTNGKIGMVGAFPYPSYLNLINGVEMGAKAVNPKATEHVIYISSFFDPTKEVSATQALIGAGVTAIVSSTADPSVCQAAAGAGIPCVGDDLIQSYGKSTYLGTAVLNSEWAFVNVISAVFANKPVTRFLYGNGTVNANGVTFGPAYKSRVPAAVRAKITATQAQMKSGAFRDYAGPVRDNKGALRLPAGRWLTQAEQAGQSWYVQGVTV
jgi:basic membrane lipoprotein Med (substrate-binding protein (PBP1-ABC) superfamily)